MIYFLAAVFILSLVLGSAKVKGYMGEGYMKFLLRRLEKEGYMSVHDIMIPNVGGTTENTQIDHVVISRFGIFVIETKNYKGWIFGNEKSQYWTQTIYKRKEKIFNPIWQNQGHIKALKALLPEYFEAPFISIVAFTERATLKKIEATSAVTYVSRVNREIRKYRTPVLPNEDVQKVRERLLHSNIKDRASKKQHVQKIRTGVSERARQVGSGVCPRCGGQLVKRKGKHGEFVGCSGYPKCRFTSK